MLVLFEVFGLIALNYIVGLVGVWSATLTRSKVVGITCGLLTIMLSAMLFVPSYQANAPWWWLMIVGAPLLLSWVSIWSVFRCDDVRKNVICGIIECIAIFVIFLCLIRYPAFIQAILRVLPLPGYPIA